MSGEIKQLKVEAQCPIADDANDSCKQRGEMNKLRDERYDVSSNVNI